MSYAANLIASSRTPITLVRITLDWCALSFGVAPCTGTGEPCYNTYHTCKARAAFSKTARIYEYSTADAPIPWPGPRPYVKAVTYLPTEITNSITITGRIKVELRDEPDGDVGIDPYLGQRASVQGSYWKKLIARNPNYKARKIEIYEGFLGDPFSEFQLRASQQLQLVTIKGISTTLQSVDLLSALSEVEVPPQCNLKLLGELSATATELVLADTADVETLADAGYVKIGDEIIQYAALDRTQRRLSGLTRAVMGSTAAEHTTQDSVQLCRYYPPANPFDIIKEMLLVDAKVDPALVDTAAIDACRDWPGEEVPMTAFLDAPVKLSDLLFGTKQQSSPGMSSADLPPDSYGLVDLLDCKVWVGEDFKITLARNIPNAPGRDYRSISDDATVITNSTSTDMNEKIRITRSVLYWDKRAIGDADSPDSYARRDIGVNYDAEKEYGETITEKIFCRWIHSSIVQDEVLENFISDLLYRRLFLRRDAAPVITLSTELKDSDILTGSFVKFITDELLNPDGTPVNTRFQVIRRDPKGSKVDLKVQRMAVRRCAFYAPEDAPVYEAATQEQREYGGFYTDDSGRMPNGEQGFYYY